MKNMSKNLIAAAFCGALLFAYTPVHAQPSEGEQGQQGGQQQRKGPPKEAFTICESKSSGASCSMDTPHGTASGTCEDPKSDGTLVCVPEGHSERGGK